MYKRQALSSSINPEPIEIPFEISIKGSYENVQKFIDSLDKSIRPVSISEIDISASTSNDDNKDISVKIFGVTYYQPAKELGINEQVVKSDIEFQLNSASRSN